MCSSAKFNGHFSPVFPCFATRISGSYYYMSLMAESGCLEQVDRGADNPTSYYYHETRKGGQGPVWAVAPLIIIYLSICLSVRLSNLSNLFMYLYVYQYIFLCLSDHPCLSTFCNVERTEGGRSRRTSDVIRVSFQVLTAASMKMTLFWDVAPCSLVEIYRRFRRAYCPRNLPDDRGSKHFWNVGQFLRDYAAQHPRSL
jgi:hypothetical protein